MKSAARAAVIGSGPNGLTAAIVLARAGLHTTVFEAAPTIGGGTRSGELTLPGFTHDVCSAVHPLGVGSPVFQSFPLNRHGLEWIHPALPLAHPLDDGSAAVLERCLEATVQRLGPDGPAYQRSVDFLVRQWRPLMDEALAPVHLPRHPVLLMRLGLLALFSAEASARVLFRTATARALFAGLAAHSLLPLEWTASSAIGWVLAGAAHAVGWPIPKGGSQKIANALASYFESLGGQIVTNARISSLDEVADAGLVMCDVTPRQFLQLTGSRLPYRFRKQLETFRHGPGVFKIDWALRSPIPWKAADCARAGTVHLGGTFDEVAEGERAPWKGIVCERPFVLLAQPSLFDSTRAPAGQHTAWAYCHVPNESPADMTSRIENQVERFAPSFRETILARHTFTPLELEALNPNLIGGDITGGAQTLKQMFLRPTRLLYRTPIEGVYLCSSSTPPGAGVHGMCGYHAARTALRDKQITPPQ